MKITIIYASSYKGRLRIHDVLQLNDDEFDDFLKKTRTKEFIVVNHFSNFFQDTINVPSIVKRKYAVGLIELEIRKRSTFTDFSYITYEKGESVVVEQKMTKEAIVFAVDNAELRRITKRFIDKKKVVRAIYPDVYALQALIGIQKGSVLCVSESGEFKTLFLVGDGVLHFARGARSDKRGLHEPDIQNINITINYCRQTLRIFPSYILLLGGLCDNYSAETSPLIPTACLSMSSIIESMQESYLDLLSPLAGLIATREVDISPDDYKNFHNIWRFLKYSTILFGLASVAGLGFTGLKVKDILDLKQEIAMIRSGLSEIDRINSKFADRKSKIVRYKPFISSINELSAIPDIEDFMAALSMLDFWKIDLDYIRIDVEEGKLKAKIEGEVQAGSEEGVQRFYRRFLLSIVRLNKFSVEGEALGLSGKRFSLRVVYK